MTTHPAAWLPAAKGLAIGFAAALLCVAVHAPLPWMIGPLVAVAVPIGWDRMRRAGGRPAGRAMGHRHGARSVFHACGRRARGTHVVVAPFRRAVRAGTGIFLRLSCRTTGGDR